MKKHNEGYTLVLVLVVMLVLTTVATAILTFSVSNLKNQQGMVDRMEAKYAAQGEIEKIVGQLDKSKVFNENSEQNTIKAMKTWLEGIFVGQTINITKDDSGVLTCSVSISADGEKNGYRYTASCAIDISGKINAVTSGEVTTGYMISNITFKHTSYEIGGAAS